MLIKLKLFVLIKNFRTFEATTHEELYSNLNLIFKKEMFESHIYELEALWNGKTHFSSTTVNYTLSGKRIDVQLRGSILPGSESTFERVLITTEDITPYQNALRQEEKIVDWLNLCLSTHLLHCGSRISAV